MQMNMDMEMQMDMDFNINNTLTKLSNYICFRRIAVDIIDIFP